MNNDTKITVPAAPAAARKGRHSKPYIDWFFGCILFSVISIVIGLALFEESDVECFLCYEDIGWALVIFSYATPGLAMGYAEGHRARLMIVMGERLGSEVWN